MCLDIYADHIVHTSIEVCMCKCLHKHGGYNGSLRFSLLRVCKFSNLIFKFDGNLYNITHLPTHFDFVKFVLGIYIKYICFVTN